MSLIYDALRQSNALPAQSPLGAPAAARPATRASARRTPLIWGSTLALGVLASGLFYAMAPAPAAPLPTTSATFAAVPAVSVPAAPMTRAPLSTTTIPPLQQPAAAAIVAAAPLRAPPETTPATSLHSAAPVPMPGTPATAPVRVATTDTIVDVQSQQLSITVSRRDSHNDTNPAQSAPAPAAASAVQIPALIKALEAAVAQSDTITIDARLATLRSQLPADSLTLLRTEAWVAHIRGDLMAAEEGYRQILARIANDEQAGVNLALLEAGRGDADGAQTRLRRLAAENGNSAMIGKALAQLQATHQ